MATCIICRFETELDDVIITSESGRCICLTCFERETDTLKPMPKALRREITAIANDADKAA